MPPLLVTIKAEQLERFCQQLMADSRDVVSAHAALSGLERFISVHRQHDAGSAEYTSVVSCLRSAIALSQQQVLDKNTADLLVAFRQCNILALTAVHAMNSENDFLQSLTNVIAQLSDDEIRLVMLWSENWMKEARQLADTSELNKQQLNSMSVVDRLFNAPA
ncbi:MAG: hypothetical protein OEY11_09445 [Gammaproteobacteria bacterium]|nr:hypothetical protein [Gammaproteobacteria bacterium]